ncbi:YpoC family protein [Aquibacillus rhizosphaerae]|uniref:YpoC-like domain-containing protein n=1 Tax=Aquibacillus rhizosphaerae TaxID=3051431 RepID=A0ABT7L4P5_9BACI|nr:hypothetical protein [Aquibacillus sp. LR5S19]MDL4840837.1 hypothetical protein [Aquibacillus sp. LR5S19]
MFDAGVQIINNWKQQTDNLASLFSERKYQQAEKPMVQYIKDFNQALYIVNKQTLHQNIVDFKYKPVNVEERIAFISNQPRQYHSYIQLNELFKELEKIYARATIMEKNKN